MASFKLLVPLLLAVILFFSGCAQPQKADLTIYTYDSMASEYGLGPAVIEAFEEQCDCNVHMIAKGDAGQVLSTALLEKGKPKADILIGIDNSMLSQMYKADVLEKFTPKNISVVPENLRFDKQGYLTPYDYGYIAFVYDSSKVNVSMNSFDSLLDPSLQKKIAIQNPRTSSPGLALLLWTVAVYGDPGYKDFWKKLKPNILTVTDSWDQSAGMFAQGEVPIYLSYATSPPYYSQFEDKNYFLAAGFKEGHYIQVEGMGIVKGTKNRLLAEKFIEFSLEKKFQQEIPLHQFMYPVNKDVKLPASFRQYALFPQKQLELDPKLVDEKEEKWILEWEKIMLSG